MTESDRAAEIVSYYESYNEVGRLTKDVSHRVEFRTNTRMIAKHLAPSSTILDVAAGPGAYAFHFAEAGHSVHALDLSPRHLEMMEGRNQKSRARLESITLNDIRRGLPHADGGFDAVFCMGPIYHLESLTEKSACIAECLRVLRPGGILVVTYLLEPDLDVGLADSVREFYRNHRYFHPDAPDAILELLAARDVRVLEHYSSDGLSLKLREFVDRLDPEQEAAWLEFHDALCESELVRRFAIHGVVVGERGLDLRS